MAAELSEDSAEFWQKKCEEQETVIKKFTVHCIKVVKKQEELLIKYQTTQDQYAILAEKLREEKEELKKAKDVINKQEELLENYQATHDQYAVLSEKLKEQKGQVKKARDDLSAERARFGTSVKLLTEDLDFQKEENAVLKKRVEEYKTELERSNARFTRQGKELAHLAQTSEATLLDYHSLLKQHELELVNHQAANTRMKELQVESTSAKRQSAALMKNISGDHKLMKALIDLEELTTKYEMDKMKFENKISSLEQQLQDEKNKLGVQALEDETARVTKERDDLLQQLADSEKLATEVQSLYSDLQKKYFELEGKYEESVNEPRISAPPPPPPPPPPLLFSIKTGIMSLIIKGKEMNKQLIKQRLGVAGAVVNQESNNIVNELKNYLDKGKVLRPVMTSRTLSVPEDKSAASELEGILKNMKKAKSEEDLTAVDDAFMEQESEFLKTFKKISQKKEDPENAFLRPKVCPTKLTTIKDEEEA